MTWFRKQMEMDWIEITAVENAEAAAEGIIASAKIISV